MSAYEDDLALALDMARTASAIALDFHTGTFTSEIKPDGSPVTEADLAIEDELLATLANERPDDAILSEERGAAGAGRRRWLLDPLDGTSFFAERGPGWGTLITLQEDGNSKVGVVTRPLEDTCWWAVRGRGAFSGTLSEPSAHGPCRISMVPRLDDARVTAWHWGNSPELEVLRRLPRFVEPSHESLRRFLSGELDAIVSIGGLEWDHAPLVLIAEEGGARFRDREGGSRIDLRGGVYGNAELASQLGRALSWF